MGGAGHLDRLHHHKHNIRCREVQGVQAHLIPQQQGIIVGILAGRAPLWLEFRFEYFTREDMHSTYNYVQPVTTIIVHIKA